MVSAQGGFGSSDQPLSINVLGPQMIVIDGVELDAPAPQQRRVLSLLASRPNEVVSREWIAQGLWGSATATQLRGLQVYVSNLRSALGKTSIDLVGNGYRLNVPAEAIDEVKFRTALTLGNDAVAHDRFDEAIEYLAFGLALWRGEPYDDLPHGDFIARRAGLLEAKLAAEDALLRAQVESLRDIGAAEALIPRSAEIHAEQPRREGRVMLHLRCLMIAGRLSDASGLANDYRNRLRADVGVEPGPQFADFYARLMRRDASLLPAAWGSSVQVPTFATPLIGRDRELELAVSLLRGDSTRLLTITGPPQVGCSRLAAATADRLGPALPGGVIWIQPDNAQDAEAMLQAVGAAVGETGSIAELRQRLPKKLGHRRTLVVVDGAAPGKLTAGLAILLASGPKVSILVTSRELVGLASEQVINLQPISTIPTEDGSPASRFVLQFAESLGTPIDMRATALDPHVTASSGLPPDLEQTAIDLLSGKIAS